MNTFRLVHCPYEEVWWGKDNFLDMTLCRTKCLILFYRLTLCCLHFYNLALFWLLIRYLNLSFLYVFYISLWCITLFKYSMMYKPFLTHLSYLTLCPRWCWRWWPRSSARRLRTNRPRGPRRTLARLQAHSPQPSLPMVNIQNCLTFTYSHFKILTWNAYVGNSPVCRWRHVIKWVCRGFCRCYGTKQEFVNTLY